MDPIPDLPVDATEDPPDPPETLQNKVGLAFHFYRHILQSTEVDDRQIPEDFDVFAALREDFIYPYEDFVQIFQQTVRTIGDWIKESKKRSAQTSLGDISIMRLLNAISKLNEKFKSQHRNDPEIKAVMLEMTKMRQDIKQSLQCSNLKLKTLAQKQVEKVLPDFSPTAFKSEEVDPCMFKYEHDILRYINNRGGDRRIYEGVEELWQFVAKYQEAYVVPDIFKEMVLDETGIQLPDRVESYDNDDVFEALQQILDDMNIAEYSSDVELCPEFLEGMDFTEQEKRMIKANLDILRLRSVLRSM
jgi:hypothetical protein